MTSIPTPFTCRVPPPHPQSPDQRMHITTSVTQDFTLDGIRVMVFQGHPTGTVEKKT